MFWAEIWKILEFFLSEKFMFLEVKVPVYLNRRVFVMSSLTAHPTLLRSCPAGQVWSLWRMDTRPFFVHFRQGRQLLGRPCCLTACQVSFWNEVYSIRKELAPSEGQFFPYRVDSFSKRYKNSLRSSNMFRKVIKSIDTNTQLEMFRQTDRHGLKVNGV